MSEILRFAQNDKEGNYSEFPSGFVILRLKAEEYNLSYILRYAQDDSLLGRTEFMTKKLLTQGNFPSKLNFIMDRASSFLSTPVAVLLGSFIIAISILLHGGIIKVGNVATRATPPPPAAPAQPEAQAPKTSQQIIDNLKGLAGQVGLDQGRFDSCLDSGEKETLVKADLDDGTKVGVNGTPAFFVNGRLISGAVPFEQFKTVIDEELNGTAASTVTRVDVGVGDLPLTGDQGAKVTLIEFSDYECPFCGRHYTQAEQQINSEYVEKGLVKFYYRDFPLSQIHPGAQKAAEAARCAGDQNKYWQYHDLLFQNQQNIF